MRPLGQRQRVYYSQHSLQQSIMDMTIGSHVSQVLQGWHGGTHMEATHAVDLHHSQKALHLENSSFLWWAVSNLLFVWQKTRLLTANKDPEKWPRSRGIRVLHSWPTQQRWAVPKMSCLFQYPLLYFLFFLYSIYFCIFEIFTTNIIDYSHKFFKRPNGS